VKAYPNGSMQTLASAAQKTITHPRVSRTDCSNLSQPSGWHLSSATSRSQRSLALHCFLGASQCQRGIKFVIRPTPRHRDTHQWTSSRFSIQRSTAQRENLDGRTTKAISVKAFACKRLASNLLPRSFTGALSMKRILVAATDNQFLRGIAC